MSDSEELYSAPDDMKATQGTASFDDLRKRFDRKSKIIKMAPDDRFISKEAPGNKPVTKPKPSFVARSTSHSPTGQLPDLNAKIAQLKSVKSPVSPMKPKSTGPKPTPPLVPPKKSKSQDTPPTSGSASAKRMDASHQQAPTRRASDRKSSERSSIYPPAEKKRTNSNRDNKENNQRSDSLKQSSNNSNGGGTHNLKPLPPAPSSNPPQKPASLDIALMDDWLQNYQEEDGEDPEEIYDDICMDDPLYPAVQLRPTTRGAGTDDLPPPPASMLQRPVSRPISYIPDMTEDDEIKEFGRPISDIQEVYDDVIAEGTEEDDQEIYQDID